MDERSSISGDINKGVFTASPHMSKLVICLHVIEGCHSLEISWRYACAAHFSSGTDVKISSANFNHELLLPGRTAHSRYFPSYPQSIFGSDRHLACD